MPCIILATYRTFTVATIRFTQCQLQYLHPPQISTSGKCHWCNKYLGNKSCWVGYMFYYLHNNHCHIYAPITVFITFTPYKFDVHLQVWHGNHVISDGATWKLALMSQWLSHWLMSWYVLGSHLSTASYPEWVFKGSMGRCKATTPSSFSLTSYRVTANLDS